MAEKTLQYSYTKENYSGDYTWYVSDVSKFKAHYPEWNYRYSFKDIFEEIYNAKV